MAGYATRAGYLPPLAGTSQQPGKSPPAEPGALGIEPLKAAEFGAAEAAPRWSLGRFSSSFVPPTWPHLHTHCQLDLGTWTRTQGFALLMHRLTMRSDPSMRSPLVCLATYNWKLRRWVDFRKCQTATATPAEPGGLPAMLVCGGCVLGCACTRAIGVSKCGGALAGPPLAPQPDSAPPHPRWGLFY